MSEPSRFPLRPSSAAAVPSAPVLPGARTRHAVSAAIGALQSMHTPKLVSHVHILGCLVFCAVVAIALVATLFDPFNEHTVLGRAVLALWFAVAAGFLGWHWHGSALRVIFYVGELGVCRSKGGDPHIVLWGDVTSIDVTHRRESAGPFSFRVREQVVRSLALRSRHGTSLTVTADVTDFATIVSTLHARGLLARDFIA